MIARVVLRLVDVPRPDEVLILDGDPVADIDLSDQDVIYANVVVSDPYVTVSVDYKQRLRAVLRRVDYLFAVCLRYGVLSVPQEPLRLAVEFQCEPAGAAVWSDVHFESLCICCHSVFFRVIRVFESLVSDLRCDSVSECVYLVLEFFSRLPECECGILDRYVLVSVLIYHQRPVPSRYGDPLNDTLRSVVYSGARYIYAVVCGVHSAENQIVSHAHAIL